MAEGIVGSENATLRRCLRPNAGTQRRNGRRWKLDGANNRKRQPDLSDAPSPKGKDIVSASPRLMMPTPDLTRTARK